MKRIGMSLLMALAILFTAKFSHAAYSIDVLSLKGGATFNNFTYYDPYGDKQIKSGWGYAYGAGYELNYFPMILIFGIDFIHFRVDVAPDNATEHQWFVNNYLAPYVAARFQANSGFYVGAGVSAWLPVYGDLKIGEAVPFGTVGANLQVAPMVFLTPELRFYYNATKNNVINDENVEQWSLLLYFGVAFRILGYDEYVM